VLLGDNFLPHGVASAQDPQFAAKFEEVYDPKSLRCEFWVVPGDIDHAGDGYAQVKRSLLSKRWKMPGTVWSFERESHGKRIAVFGVDTTELLGDIVRPSTRIAHRLLVHGIEKSQADWTIVC